jgi:outer membrane immunogenic protein
MTSKGDAVMKGTIRIAAIAALIGTPALAADIAVNAPPPPAPVYSWTGWYVGGNVGYGWGDAPTDIQSNATTSFGGGLLPGFTNPPVAFSDSSTRQLKGFIGGGQFGYNYQVRPHWVLGFEADIQGSGEKVSGNFVNSFSTA